MMEVTPESVLARYRVRGLLARGATGAVYRGIEQGTGRQVAIKIVRYGSRPHAATVARAGDLRWYAATMRALQHPGIVAVYEAAALATGECLVTALAPGVDLRRYQRHAALPLHVALSIGCRLAAALGHAHRHGVVHGDVKPANVIYHADTGEVRLTDFTIGAANPGGEPVMPGTPLYMAPERLCGGTAHAASDQFSLAVTLYRMVCGVHPYPGTSAPEIVWNMSSGAACRARSRNPALPRALDDALARALASASDQRYPTIEAFGDALARIRSDTEDGHAAGQPLPGAATTGFLSNFCEARAGAA